MHWGDNADCQPTRAHTRLDLFSHKSLQGENSQEAGKPGLPGVPGEEGAEGEPGEKGEAGEKGTTGEKGVRGRITLSLSLCATCY